MAGGAMMDRQRLPDVGAFVGAVGKAGAAWDELTGRVQDMGARGAPSWGGSKCGWELRFTRAGKPFATLTPQDDAFVALVVLGREQAEAASSLTLSEPARRTLDEAKQLHDGRWLFLRVETPDHLGDVLALLALKLPARVRAAIG